MCSGKPLKIGMHALIGCAPQVPKKALAVVDRNINLRQCALPAKRCWLHWLNQQSMEQAPSTPTYRNIQHANIAVNRTQEDDVTWDGTVGRSTHTSPQHDSTSATNSCLSVGYVVPYCTALGTIGVIQFRFNMAWA